MLCSSRFMERECRKVEVSHPSKPCCNHEPVQFTFCESLFPWYGSLSAVTIIFLGYFVSYFNTSSSMGELDGKKRIQAGWKYKARNMSFDIELHLINIKRRETAKIGSSKTKKRDYMGHISSVSYLFEIYEWNLGLTASDCSHRDLIVPFLLTRSRIKQHVFFFGSTEWSQIEDWNRAHEDLGCTGKVYVVEVDSWSRSGSSPVVGGINEHDLLWKWWPRIGECTKASHRQKFHVSSHLTTSVIRPTSLGHGHSHHSCTDSS